MLTAGLFNSYISYQSLYTISNLNYTRSYIADNSPYLLFGLAGRYPINEALTVALYVINGYSYLSHPNNQPSYGSQVTWKAAPRITVTENLYYGSDQADTALKFWRFFSDSIVEWRGDRLTLALVYDFGTENAAEEAGNPRTFWMGERLFRSLECQWAVEHCGSPGSLLGSERPDQRFGAVAESHHEHGGIQTVVRETDGDYAL
jgi:hypothetical protein